MRAFWRQSIDKARAFWRDQGGGVTVFITPMFLYLLVITGIALDFARHEAERADLQNALDRCALAAASLRQTQDARTVCNDYMRTRAFQDQSVEVQVAVEQSAQNRSVRVGVNTRFDTTALALVGLSEFSVGVESAAREGDDRIEVSLVLDISGSMARDKTRNALGLRETRLRVMKDAAKSFVSQTLGQALAGQTSISLIPFAGGVNAGPFFDILIADGAKRHNYASCIDFVAADYRTHLLPIPASRDQTPHFQHFYYERLRGQRRLPFNPLAGNNADWGWCPVDRPEDQPSSRIVPFSSDADNLNQIIEAFEGHDGTGTPVGLKWGVSLLSHDNIGLIQEAGRVEGSGMNPLFHDRPGVNGANGPQKVLILMSDGRIRHQPRPLPRYYDSPGEIQDLAFNESKVVRSGSGLATTNNLRLNSRNVLRNSREADEDQDEQRRRALQQCRMAQAMGITVYTIAFDIDPADEFGQEAVQFLRACARKDGEGAVVANFLEARDGAQLEQVFSKLVAEITRLSLFR